MSGVGVWDEDGIGNIYRENGNVGIGFGQHFIGIEFTGYEHGSQSSYADFDIETLYSGKSTLRMHSDEDFVRYSWTCGTGKIERMKLEMASDNSVSTVLILDGSLQANSVHADNIYTSDLLQALRIKTYGLQLFSSTNVSGYVLQADPDGDATWVEQWKKESNGVLSSQNAVVIGTTNTTVGNHKLVVAGSINAQEILVTETVPGSDFVFEEDYELMPLSELESYVKTKKHLPEVMSAEEFKENGYNIGEMDDVLLRKVEELTLYMIAQQKEIEELKKKLSSLEDKK